MLAGVCNFSCTYIYDFIFYITIFVTKKENKIVVNILQIAILIKYSFLLIFLSLHFSVFPHWLQERFMVVNQESRSLHALSRDLLRLERSHETRNGEECGIETSDAKTNYFCDETVNSMNGLMHAFREFRDKLDIMVSWWNQIDNCKVVWIKPGKYFQAKYNCRASILMLLSTRKRLSQRSLRCINVMRNNIQRQISDRLSL